MLGVSRLDFDFSSLGAGGSVTRMPLAQALDISEWGGATAALRIHALNLGAGTSFRVDLVATCPSPTDPAPFFRGPIVATFEVAAGQLAAPTLLVSALSRYAGSHVGVFLSVAQGSPQAALSFTLSLELVPLVGTDAWTPLSLGPKLKLWLDQRDQVVVSGAISDWGDQSAANNDFTQPTAGLRPASGVTINTFAAPSFDGTDDALDLAGGAAMTSLASASAYHAFVVARFDSITLNQPNAYDNHVLIGDTGAFWALAVGTPGVQGMNWDGALKATAAIPVATGTAYLIEWSFDGTTVRCRVGGGATQSIVSGNISNTTFTARLGRGWLAGYLDGSIASVVCCNEYLSAADARNVRGYLSSLYGVPA